VTIYPQCLDCKHLNTDPETGRSDFTCAAYPAGIPQDILLNERWHDRPQEGDHGTQFAPADGAPGPFAKLARAGVPFGGPTVPAAG
jgi:hypothetical protein